MERFPQISDGEWDVMKVVWKQPGCSASHVIETLAGKRHWGPATVKTLLNRLTKKGALSFEKEENFYRYTATFSEDAMRRTETQNFIDRVFDGAFTPFLAKFVKGRRLSAEEIAELEALLREGRKGK